MKKKIKDLNDTEKHQICKATYCDRSCPLNFKDNKEYCNGYFACWYDVEEEHINYCKGKFNNVDEELQKIYNEQNGEQEIEVEDYE